MRNNFYDVHKGLWCGGWPDSFENFISDIYIYIWHFMHLADAFIQSNLQLHWGYTFSISFTVSKWIVIFFLSFLCIPPIYVMFFGLYFWKKRMNLFDSLLEFHWQTGMRIPWASKCVHVVMVKRGEILWSTNATLPRKNKKLPLFFKDTEIRWKTGERNHSEP